MHSSNVFPGLAAGFFAVLLGGLAALLLVRSRGGREVVLRRGWPPTPAPRLLAVMNLCAALFFAAVAIDALAFPPGSRGQAVMPVVMPLPLVATLVTRQLYLRRRRRKPRS